MFLKSNGLRIHNELILYFLSISFLKSKLLTNILLAFLKKNEKIICLKKFFDQPADDEFDLEITFILKILAMIIT